MPHTIDNALDDELIEVVERDDGFGEYAIRLGELETVITIQLRRLVGSEHTEFTVSHAIHTPTQADPYRTSIQYGDYPAQALSSAVFALTQYYRAAVRAGHNPDESWLVPN